MAYTAQQLITRSWYLSGIVGRNLQTSSGDQITDGLALLNAFLDFKSIQIDSIPYWTYDTSITCVPGQENYFLPNCVAVESVTFNIDTVRYPMDSVSRRKYYASGRIDSISSLPFSWNYNRSLGGGTLALYFLPAGNYPLKIMGKFALQDVTLSTDLLTVYDAAYVEYLRYGLAEYMCSEYGILFNPESKMILKAIQRQLMDISPPDISMRKVSILVDIPGYNYGDVNIGHGFRP